MRVLLVAHVGETLGHVIRGLAIADQLRALGVTLEFACSPAARVVVTDRGYPIHELRWFWSHNACGIEHAGEGFLAGVTDSARDLLGILGRARPDCVLGLPGIASRQVADALGVPHVSVLHAPYLAPLLATDGLSEQERAVVTLARRVCAGPVNETFRTLAAKLRLPMLNYESFVASETMYVPQGGLGLPARENLHAVEFIAASFGPPTSRPESELRETCYISFGSGNPCDLTMIIEEASAVFAHVLVTIGRGPMPTSIPPNVAIERFSASSSLAGRVRAVISHGGLGTIGTFGVSGTPHLIVPTELDQAIAAIYAERIGIASHIGIEDHAARRRLGRRLPELGREQLRERIEELAACQPRTGVRSNGAQQIAQGICAHIPAISEAARMAM